MGKQAKMQYVVYIETQILGKSEKVWRKYPNSDQGRMRAEIEANRLNSLKNIKASARLERR